MNLFSLQGKAAVVTGNLHVPIGARAASGGNGRIGRVGFGRFQARPRPGLLSTSRAPPQREH